MSDHQRLATQVAGLVELIPTATGLAALLALACAGPAYYGYRTPHFTAALPEAESEKRERSAEGETCQRAVAAKAASMPYPARFSPLMFKLRSVVHERQGRRSYMLAVLLYAIPLYSFGALMKTQYVP